MKTNVIVRTDSDGEEHLVLMQAHENSCGPAAVAMAESIANGTPLSGSIEARMRAIGSKFPGSWWIGELMKGVLNFQTGSVGNNLVKICMDIGLQIREGGWFKPPFEIKDLGPQKPAIVLVGWYAQNGEREGGHFIVAAKVAKNGRVVYLDPWNGMLIEHSNNGLFPLTTLVGHDFNTNGTRGIIEGYFLVGK